MKNIHDLLNSGHITERQALTAAKFLRRPADYRLAPSLFATAHALIIEAEPLERFERRKGWAARSAKVVLGELLFAMQEMSGSHADEDAVDRMTVDDLREVVRYLTGDCDEILFDLMARYSFTAIEARIFAVLHSRNAPISKETIFRRVYADRAEDDWPESKVLDVHICNMRKKLLNDWVIRTHYGVGYSLEAVVGSGQRTAKGR